MLPASTPTAGAGDLFSLGYADIVRIWMLRYVHRGASERHERLELDLHGEV